MRNIKRNWEMDLYSAFAPPHLWLWKCMRFLHIVCLLIKCFLKRFNVRFVFVCVCFIFCCTMIFVAWIMAEYIVEKGNSISTTNTQHTGYSAQDKWDLVVAEWNVDTTRNRRMWEWSREKKDENMEDYVIKTHNSGIEKNPHRKFPQTWRNYSSTVIIQKGAKKWERGKNERKFH